MARWLTRRLQGLARCVLALIGVVGLVSAAAPAAAAAAPQSARSVLEGRVAEMRRHLNDPAARDDAAPTLIAQAGRWNNWPNWSNWANWRNG
jgi:hypothetical protein